MEVKVKKLKNNAIIPKYSKFGDAGLDLTITDFKQIDNEHIKYNFGLAFEIPLGYVGFIFPRSSCYKQRQLLSNCVGVIDSGYRGEVSAVMIGTTSDKYKVGERCAQMIIMPYPQINLITTNELSETERGKGGYGSSGK